ncbi:hypothetical protein [Croceimicrobium hydrocarbonivorans]|uniref:Lipocalin-like domain-containing protein n=1 Tax=Croceimicrobium hydrocarbonivorans TaxID=2761580 RepID=A0A7H0VAD7_9FLAO|nr:hypothetical protein [Croceimicrobium hydrocarbonivorans]QNR22685.1 hypothetical protein H4K34_09850 [Croceimicrobium hydrocarbonivorans]
MSMKNIGIIAVLVLSLAFVACRKKDDGSSSQAPLTGLAAFLNGEFEVTQANYNGSLQSGVLGTIPLAGTGTNTSGSYNFAARNKTVDYQVSSTMEINLFGQTLPVPINVGGDGDVTYTSDTQFIIDDPSYGPMTYNISNKTETSLIATTRYQNDTTFGTVDLLLDVYLTKK